MRTLILTAAPGSYGAIFTTSFWVAIVGLAVLVLFVRNAPARSLPKTRERPSIRTSFGLLKHAPFRRLVIAGVAFSLVTITDALVYITFQQRSSYSTRYFPLLFVGTAGIYLLFALPMGRLADRVGPARVFLTGQVLLVAVDVALLQSAPGVGALFVMLGSLGLYYAMTDGVLAALATAILPPGLRASGLAVLNASMAVGGFVAALVYGALWGWQGSNFAVTTFLIGLVVALMVGAVLLLPMLRAGAEIERVPAGDLERAR